MIKKIIGIAFLAGACVWVLNFFIAQYYSIEKNVNTPDKKGGSGLAAQYGVVDSTFGQDSAAGKSRSADNLTKAAPPPAPPKAANDSPVISTGQPNEVMCTGDLEAFDPAHPSQIIGKFIRGSVLTIGGKDATTGMFMVTFLPKDGPAIRALCRAKDLGF